MLTVKTFWDNLNKLGFSFFSGVPCSILKVILKTIPENSVYISAVREDSALGVASGAYLSGKKGKKTAILIQNSGLGNIIDGLTSFNLIYKIPVLIIVTWRGEPEKPDAPEHQIMGKVMLPILKALGIPYKIIDDDFPKQLAWASEMMEKDKIPVVLILREGVIK